MTLKKPTIGLIPIGNVSQIIPKSLAAHINGHLKLDVDILPPLEEPSYAHDMKRFQYDAGVILKAFESYTFQDYTKIVGILDLDIFVPILTHVLGEAKQGGKYALVSVYRLKKNSDGSIAPISLLLERAAKVAIHELGHLFDLYHCMDRKCIMHFSGEPSEVDRAPLLFCRYCSIFLRDALQRLSVVG